jgi:DNA polymerase I-like protein with 3'-5' exonuclease and polymerase domains/uracil-DNA glycosylase
MKCEGAKCSECPLNIPKDKLTKESGGHFVPPEANRNAKFVVIGDQPSMWDSVNGRPFTGTDANEMTSILRLAGAKRGEIHWTNVVLCSPPKSDMERFLIEIKKANKKLVKLNKERAKEGLDPLPSIKTPHECCAPRLQKEISSFTNIICAGTTALKAVVHRSASIMDLRGGPMEVEKGNKILNVLPVMHPGYVDRNKRWYLPFASDLKRAVKWFKRGRLDWKPPEILWNPDPVALREFLFTDGVPFWTYDVETDGIECLTANLRCIAIGTPDAVVLIAYLGIDGHSRFYSDEELEQITAVLKDFFEDERIVKAGHNAGYYDKIVMREQLDIDVKPCVDTMLLHRLSASELPHTLGFCGSYYTEAPSWKTDRQGRKKAYGSETDHELHEYCAWDTAVTAAILPPIMKEITYRDQVKLSECDHKLQEICAEMHIVGMYVDQKARAGWEKKLIREVYDRREKIRTILDNPKLNPGSPHQIRELIYEKWRLDPPVEDRFLLTKSGDPSTGDHILRALLSIKSLTPMQRAAIQEMRYYRKCQKVLGTYVTKLRYDTEEAWGGWDADDDWMEKEFRDRYGVKKLGIVDPSTGRMHPGYNAHVTTSGRLSSSKPINAQNFPHPLRGLVIPQPGNVLVGADMDQLELRIAASRWESEKYLRAFEQGFDPHSTVTAVTVFGDMFKEAARECGAGEYPYLTGTKFSGTAKKLRGLSKSVQYASQYWAACETVHRVITQTEVDNGDGTTDLPYIGISVREVRVMHAKWVEGAQFDEGWERELGSWKKEGYLEEPIMGRRRDFLDGENINEIVNFPIQAAGASLMNIALIELHKRIPLYKWGRGTGIINQCHDSIVVECPENQAEWVREQIEECMNLIHESMPRVEFTATADIGMTWKDV